MKTLFAHAVGIVVLIVSSAACAGSGKAYVPHWAADGASYTNQWSGVWVNNISSHSLAVTVTFYQEDGTAVSSSALTYQNFTSSNTALAAGTSGYVKIQTSSWHYGYAVVTWQNSGTDNDLVGLSSHAEWIQLQSGGIHMFNSMLVNHGLPF